MCSQLNVSLSLFQIEPDEHLRQDHVLYGKQHGHDGVGAKTLWLTSNAKPLLVSAMVIRQLKYGG